MKKLYNLFLTNKLIQASTIVFVGQMVVNVANYFFNIAQGRILTTEHNVYGNFWALSSISNFGTIPTLAITLTASKLVAEWSAQKQYNLIKIFLRKSFFIILWITLITHVLTLIFTKPITQFLKIDDNISFFLVISGITISLFTSLYTGALGGFHAFGKQTSSNIIGILAKLVVGIGLAISIGLAGAFIGIYVRNVIVFLIAAFFTFKFFKNIEQQTTQEKFKFPWKFFIGVLVTSTAFGLFQTLDVLFVKIRFSEIIFENSDLDIPSIYSMISIFGRIIFFLAYTFALTLTPISSFKNASKEKTISLLSQSMALALIVIIPTIAIMFAIPDVIVKFSFGEKFLPGAKLIYLYAIAVAFYSLGSIINNYLISIGKYKYTIIPFSISFLEILAFIIWGDSLIHIILIQILLFALLLLLLTIYILFIEKSKK